MTQQCVGGGAVRTLRPHAPVPSSHTQSGETLGHSHAASCHARLESCEMLVFPQLSWNHGLPEGWTANGDSDGPLQLPGHDSKEGLEVQGEPRRDAGKRRRGDTEKRPAAWAAGRAVLRLSGGCRPSSAHGEAVRLGDAGGAAAPASGTPTAPGLTRAGSARTERSSAAVRGRSSRAPAPGACVSRGPVSEGVVRTALREGRETWSSRERGTLGSGPRPRSL